MPRMLSVCLAVIAALALAAPASGQAPNPPLNGAYYGVYPPTNTVVAMAIRNNVIGPTSVFSMGFNGDISTSGASPTSFFPGTYATTLANPGGVKLNSQGNWSIPAVPSEFGFFAPPLCGQSRSNYLVAGMACTEGASGLNQGAVPLFSLRKATLNFPSGSQFSGSVNATPRNPNQASNPATPWTGPEGSITLTVSGSGSNATVTGSGSLTPVNPQTGIPTGAPPINVLYGPAPVSSTPTSDEGTGGLSTSTGFFSLPSSPPGYTACGAILPTGFAFGNIGCGGTLPYVPATFFLTGVSTG